MDSKRFADHTQQFLNMLPHWFEMRQNLDSVGAKFLNVIGLSYDELSLTLTEAEEQLYLQTASVDGLDILYKVLIPVHLDSSNITKVFSDHRILKRATSISDFKNMRLNGEFDLLQEHHTYFLDESKNILYVRYPYDAFDDCPYGRISFVLDNETYHHNMSIHQVWNFLDEFGLLLCCPRLTGERNEAYKERLMDAYKHPGGASKIGLMNGIGRELALRKRLVWENPSESFIIPDGMVVLNSIEINDNKISNEDYIINVFGEVEILPNKDLKPSSIISYLHGIEMHQLGDREDSKLQQELLNVDNTASDLLKYYVERIHLEAPIHWGHFKWDESYWDTANPEVAGTAFIPNLHDARIEGFSAYQ